MSIDRDWFDYARKEPRERRHFDLVGGQGEPKGNPEGQPEGKPKGQRRTRSRRGVPSISSVWNGKKGANKKSVQLGQQKKNSVKLGKTR